MIAFSLIIVGGILGIYSVSKAFSISAKYGIDKLNYKNVITQDNSDLLYEYKRVKRIQHASQICVGLAILSAVLRLP